MDTENKKGLLERFKSPETSLVKYGKLMTIISCAIILAGIIVVAVFNFNLGLDFTGGTIITVDDVASLDDQVVYDDYVAKIRQEFSSNLGVTGAEFQRQESVDSGYSMTITYNNDEADTAAISAAVETITGGNVTSIDDLGAKMGSENLFIAILAIGAAMIGILVYVIFRFKFTSGVAAIIALIHDALIMLALVAITRIQINTSFVAALITIIGYSINNTLVLFDRVREIEKDKESRQTTTQIVDRSIKETLGRTINTTVTTLIPIFVLAVIGLPLIREFAVPIIFGLVAGTFSSIFLTTALYVRFENARLINQRRKAMAK